MVSSAGFNALLKTLEEPPKHVMFVLCTTEAHKVPETIVSRCARVSFARASLGEMIESLQRVVDGESLKISTEALALVAEAADGSFREGHKLLEQLANFGSEISGLAKSLWVWLGGYVKKLVER
jgi:DNA polymerase-3 subunit gamma/tau